jgi:hypothetical protein
VSRDVIRWDGGAGEDELAGLAAIVDRAANVVPDRGLQLPLVDQARRGAREHERRIYRGRLAGVGVGVEQDLARGDPPCGGCLSTGLRTLDGDGTGRTQPSRKLVVDDPGEIGKRHPSGKFIEIPAGRM